MATPAEKLAKSLEKLKSMQDDDGLAVVRSRDLSESDRKLLLNKGFIKKVMKGWYIPCRPDEQQGDSTSWYVSYWKFCALYLRERFGDNWVLSPEHSLLQHAGNRAIPKQLIVRAPGARNKVTDLIHETSLLEVRAKLPSESEVTKKNGIRLFSVASGLANCNPGFFSQHHIDARALLGVMPDPSEILHLLLQEGKTTIAGRLAGAFRNAGRAHLADDIMKTMRKAGFEIRESDPFMKRYEPPPIPPSPPLPPSLSLPPSPPLPPSLPPHIIRLHLLWNTMRETVIGCFPKAPGLPADQENYLKSVEDVYAMDAYHSLSIEGYRVSAQLIDKVRSGNWNPEWDDNDKTHRDAMAARGYWQAFLVVKKSVKKVLDGENAGAIAARDHGDWFREMFSPGVTAGILKASDLAGYRNTQVFIQRSRHIPPAAKAAREMISELFELLKKESVPGVRAVLGHFFFVFIHPYMDGNGRMARFLMNVMLASGGYPWTVMPVENRSDYMHALERASVHQDIRPFSELVARFVETGIAGGSVTPAPEHGYPISPHPPPDP